jgi:hypothetical protein
MLVFGLTEVTTKGIVVLVAVLGTRPKGVLTLAKCSPATGKFVKVQVIDVDELTKFPHEVPPILTSNTSDIA